jgi:hypothetical protein
MCPVSAYEGTLLRCCASHTLCLAHLPTARALCLFPPPLPLFQSFWFCVCLPPLLSPPAHSPPLLPPFSLSLSLSLCGCVCVCVCACARVWMCCMRAHPCVLSDEFTITQRGGPSCNGHQPVKPHILKSCSMSAGRLESFFGPVSVKSSSKRKEPEKGGKAGKQPAKKGGLGAKK